MNPALDFLFARFRQAEGKTSFVEADGTSTTFATLLDRVTQAQAKISVMGIKQGDVVQLCGDFGVASAAWLLALWGHSAIVTLLSPASTEKRTEFAQVADASWVIEAATGCVTPGPGHSQHTLYDRLRADAAPGLIIFTSGTTGVSKGAVHDMRRLLLRFQVPGKDFTTLGFLLFDHIAGVDTLLYCLSNASTLVCLADRAVETVIRSIADFRVEVLPTAPSFLNIMLMSRGADDLRMPHLKIITYGAEMMPQGLLDRVNQTFPAVKLIQKYGTSELGALRSRSDSERSRWISLDSSGTDWRIVEGLLEIKSETAMLGYLNAASPFTADGWYKTGDRVEVRGDQIRFLGRDSDMINVGGQKVFPAEVENAILEMPQVREVAVYGRPHPILGQSVCANIRM